jgi:two-component system, OmpR family, response regulator
MTFEANPLIMRKNRDNAVYDRSIDIQVFRLRRKIEIDPSQPQFILTERGLGYSFNSPVEILY